jgi:arylsulfatase A-like enzyme
MERARGAAAIGGLYAGTFLGAIAGTVEAVMFLEGANLRDSFGSSILFILLSISLYALAMGAAGAVIGYLASFLPYLRNRKAAGRYGYPFAVAFGTVVGIFTFVLGMWWARMAPPDLSIFRRYCRTDTMVVILISVVAGRLLFHAAHPIVRRERVERYFASRWSRMWTFAKLGAGALLLLVVLVLGLDPTGDAGRSAASDDDGQVAPPAMNVVLITIDTLRANHLEHLGYRKPTSPLTRELAGAAVVFREAVAQYPLTTPSHASILTGRYVRSHGATANAVPIHGSAVLLSEVLKSHGYSTAAFVTSPIIGEKYGFSRGYDYFVERNSGDFSKSSLSDWMGQLRILRVWWRFKGLNRTTVAAERWLLGNPDAPFFLWLHYITPHSPYSPPFSYERRWDTYRSKVVPSIQGLGQINSGEVEPTAEDIDHIVALYDAEIEFTENMLTTLIDALDRMGVRENTLIVFTADHGESLYDRSFYFGHGKKLYDEEILVPLFFYCPGHLPEGRTIDEQVETIHIAPTILDFLGLPPEQSFQGMSLMNIIDPGSRDTGGPHVLHPLEEKPAFSINHNGRMVRFHGWKYIEIDDELGTEELYDLTNDPGETKNVVFTDTGKAAELRALLRSWNSSVPVVRSESYELDAESLRALRALGYVD